MSSIRSVLAGVVAGAVVAGGAMYLLVGSPAGAANGPQQAAAQRAAGLAANAAGGRAAAAAVSGSDGEMLFKPTAPCRVVDTRSGGGTLANGVSRNFQIAGTANFSGQGGHSGGCGVPLTATAVAVTITAVSPSHEGYFRAWATGGTEPTSSFMNYGTAFNASGSGPLPLSSAGKLTIRNEVSTTQVLVDISGYYENQIRAVINSTGAIYAASPRVLSSANLSTGQYQVTIDRDLTNCTPIASIDGGPYLASAFVSGTSVYADTYDTSGSALNLYWTLTITC